MSDIAAIHCSEIRDSVFPLLGARFLRKLYRVLMKCDETFGYVDDVKGIVNGFVFCTTSREITARKLDANRSGLAVAAIGGLIRRPWLALALLGNRNYGRRIHAANAELFSIAVDGRLQKSGLGSQLISAAQAGFRKRGISRYSLTVYSSNRSACSFYRAIGMTEAGKIALFGREMLEFVDDLKGD